MKNDEAVCSYGSCLIKPAKANRQFAEGFDVFGLPGATLQLAARSLTIWAITRMKRKYEVSVLINHVSDDSSGIGEDDIIDDDNQDYEGGTEK